MDNNVKLLGIKDKKVAIQCPTYEEAKQLMSLFARNRITWRLNVSAESRTNWEKYGIETCYTLDNIGISYANKHYYEMNGYEVVLLKDFLVESMFVWTDVNVLDLLHSCGLVNETMDTLIQYKNK